MPFFTAIVTVLGIWGFMGFTIGPVAAFAIKTAASLLISRLAQELSKRGSKPKSQHGLKGYLQRGADLSQSVLMGNCATAGSLTYANTWGSVGSTPNAYFTQVISLSDMPIQSLDGLWVNGSKVTINATPHADYGYPVDEFRPESTDNMWIKFYDGTQVAADQFLIDNVSTTERPWTANAVGAGTAYVIITCRNSPNTQLWTGGFPEFLFEVTGVPLYDISKDSSEGGSGTHRWNNPATWGGDGDTLPAVQLYNVLRGMYYGSEWVYGLQTVTTAQLPAAHWISQVAGCRATVTGDGGAEPTYRSAGEFPVAVEIAETVRALLDACNGRLSEVGGAYKLHIGGVGSSVASFTDAEILSTEEQSFSPFFGLADTVNGIVGKYPSPEAGWQVETAPPLFNSDYEAEDGNRRLMVDAVFDLVPYPEQVQRLMLGAMNESRRARRHTIVMPPEYWTIEPEDIVDFTSERNGYISKDYRIDGVADLANGDVIWDMTEVDNTDYDFDTVTDYTPVTDPGVLIQAIPTHTVESFTVKPVAIQDASGTDRIPGIQCNWNQNVDDIDAIKVQVRVDATQAAVWAGTFRDFDVGYGYVTEGLLPNVAYEVRAKYIPGSQRPTSWTGWLDVTTPDLKITAADIAPFAITWSKLAQEIIDDFAGLSAETEVAAIIGGGNLITDPLGQASENWGASIGGIVTTNTHTSEIPSSATNIMVTMPADGDGGCYSPELDIGSFSGRIYRVTFMAKISEGCVGTMTVQAYHREGAGAWVGGNYVQPEPAISSSWQAISVTVNQGAGTGNELKFRWKMDNGSVEDDHFKITDFWAEDVTESLRAAGSADAAAISEDNAFDYEDDAGKHASAALRDQTKAYAAYSAAAHKNLVIDGTGTQNDVNDYWLASDNAEVSYGVNTGTPAAGTQIILTNTNAADSWIKMDQVPAKTYGNWANRIFRLSYIIDSSDTAWDTQVGLVYYDKDGVATAGADVEQATTTWTVHDTHELTCPADCVALGVRIVMNGPQALGDWTRITDFTIIDVTELNAAAASAATATTQAGFASDANDGANSSEATALGYRKLAAYAQQAATTGNIVQNGQFIDDVLGWRTQNDDGIVGWYADTSLNKPTLGRLSVEVVDTGDGTIGAEMVDRVYENHDEDDTLTFSYWSRKNASGTVIVRLKMQVTKASDGTTASYYGDWKTTNSSWSEYTGNFTLNQDITSIRISLQIDDDPGLNVGDIARFSDVVVRNTSQVDRSEGFAVAAGISESLATQAKIDADAAAGIAEYNRDVTVAMLGGESYDNALFMNWDSTYPDGVQSGSQSEGTITKLTGGKYGNHIKLDVANTPTANRPYLRWRSSEPEFSFRAGGSANANNGMKIICEFEKDSGTWNNGGGIRIEWQSDGGTNATSYYYFNDFRGSAANDEIIMMDFVALKPTTYSNGGSASYINIYIFGTANTSSKTRADAVWKVHRLSISDIANSSEASLTQTAIADIEGNAQASFVFKTRAGTSDGSMSIVSLANTTGSSTKIKLRGDEIELDGMAVFKDDLKSNNFIAGSKGWRINYLTETAEFNDVIIRKSLVLVSNQFTYSGTLSNGSILYFVNTGVKMGTSDVWKVTDNSFIIAAAVTSGASGPGGLDGNNSFWGLDCRLVSGARWFGWTGGSPTQPSANWQDDPSTMVNMPGKSGTDQRLFFHIQVRTQGGVYFNNPLIKFKVFKNS